MAQKLIPPDQALKSGQRYVEEPPIFAGSSSQGAPPVAFVGPSPSYAASLPLALQLTPDIMPTRYPGGLGGYRIFPVGPSGNPGINAAVQSVIENTTSLGQVTLTMPPEYTVTESQSSNGELLAVSWVPELHNTFLAGPPTVPTISFGSEQHHTTSVVGTTISSLAVTITAGASGILAGDTAFAIVGISSGGSGDMLNVTGLTDSLGNTWKSLSPQYNYVDIPNSGSDPICEQVWYATMQTAVPASLTFTLTATYSGNAYTGSGGNYAGITFIDAVNLGAFISANGNAYSTGAATLVSGPVTTTKNACILVFSTPVVHTSPQPSGYTNLINDTNSAFADTLYVYTAGGSYVAPPATYTTSLKAGSGSSGGFAILAAFDASFATDKAIPVFRAIVSQDLPPINLASLGYGGVTGLLSVASGGTGTSTPGLIAGTGVTITGTWPDQTVSAVGFSNPMTTKGDIIYENATPAPARLAIGSTGQVLTVAAGLPSWAAGLTNPMTTDGDIIFGQASGAPTRLAIGSLNQVLTVDSSGEPSWMNASSGFANPMTTKGDIIFENATPAPDRLPIGTTGQVLTVVSGLPAWAAGGGGGGASNVFTSNVQWAEDQSNSAFATKGVVSTCLQAITVYSLSANVYGNSGDVYQAAILTMSSATAISGVLATSGTYTFASTVTGPINFKFSSPPTLTPGNIYAFVIEITSGTGTTICSIDATASTTQIWLCPGMTPTSSFARIAAVAPSSGTLLTGSAIFLVVAVASL